MPPRSQGSREGREARAECASGPGYGSRFPKHKMSAAVHPIAGRVGFGVRRPPDPSGEEPARAASPLPVPSPAEAVAPPHAGPGARRGPALQPRVRLRSHLEGGSGLGRPSWGRGGAPRSLGPHRPFSPTGVAASDVPRVGGGGGGGGAARGVRGPAQAG